MRSLAALLLSCAALLSGGRAGADDHPPGERLRVEMSDASRGEIRFAIVDMRFDLQRQSARLGLGGGPLRFQSDILIREDGYARVRAGLDLTLGDTRIKLQLPALDVAPQDVNGATALVVRLPIVEKSF